MKKIGTISLHFLSPRRALLLASAALILLMLLFPPFHVGGYHGPPFNLGYAWIFSPPRPQVATIDGTLLLVQLAGTLIVTLLVYFALPPNRSMPASAPINASQRMIDAILESDAEALHAALSELISAEIARRG